MNNRHAIVALAQYGFSTDPMLAIPEPCDVE